MDTIYRPADDGAPAPERAVTGRVFEAPDSRDLRSADKDAIAVERATAELREQRKRTGDPWNPGPVIQRKYAGDDAPSEISLRKASADVALTRRGERVAQQHQEAQ